MPNGPQSHPSTSSAVQVIGDPGDTNDTEVSAASTYVKIRRSLSTAGCGPSSISFYLRGYHLDKVVTVVPTPKALMSLQY